MAEQHIALTKACYGSDDDKMALDYLALKYVNHDNIKKKMNDQNKNKSGNRSRSLQVGIFNSECSAKAIFNQAKSSVTKQLSSLSPLPTIDLYIQDNDDITFAYIPEQLEHILYELLSNSIKYTIQQHQHEQKDLLPPVKVTICANKTDIFFRVSDQACGIKPNIYQRLWSYQERAASGDFNDFQVIRKMPATMAERMKLEQQQKNINSDNDNNKQIDDPSTKINASSSSDHHIQHKDHVTLGIGLIMSRIFAEYFGGELQVMTLEGYGTDVYVRIPRLGSHTENLGIDLKHRHQQYHHQHLHRHHQHHHQQQLQQSQNKIHQQHQVSFSTTESTSQINIKTKHHLSRQTLEPKEGWSSSSMIIS